MRNQAKDLPLRPTGPVFESVISAEDDFDASMIWTHDDVFSEFHDNALAKRAVTEELIAGAIRKQHPYLTLTITPTAQCDLLSFASAGHASATSIDDNNGHTENLKFRFYVPAARRMDKELGFLADSIQFGKYLYKWEV
jgi:transitional endoplasmic reticulum ATPase